MNGSTDRPAPATRSSGQTMTSSKPFGVIRCGSPNSATYSVAVWQFGPTRICPGSASDWRREARLTHSPTAIRSRSRSVAPRSINASPVSIPARMPIGVPESAAQRVQADAARSARSGSSACEVGAPNRTKTASPMNFSIVPPRAVMRSLIERNVPLGLRLEPGSRRLTRLLEPGDAHVVAVELPGSLHAATGHDDGRDPATLLADRRPPLRRHDVAVVGAGAHHVLIEPRQQP